MTDATAPSAWRGWVNIVVGRLIFAVLYRVTAVGRSRVPRSGPVLFVCNHIGFLDGPLLPCMVPRPTSVLVKRDSFVGVTGVLLHFLGHIPVTRDAGDRSALTTALAVLAGGGAVGIFPEGARGRGDAAAVRQGAAWLALQGHARVVPVAFLGTRATGAAKGSLPPWRTRMVVEFGEPVDLTTDPALTGRQRLAAASGQVQALLSRHVAAAQERHQIALPEDDGVFPSAE